MPGTRKTPRNTEEPAAADAPAAPAERPADATASRLRKRRRSRAAAVEMQERQPVMGNSQKAAPKTKAPPQPAYWLKFDLDRWDVFGGEASAEPRVLPALSKAKLQPGANGVGKDRKGRPVVDMMIGQIESDGHTLIPFGIDGDGTSYIMQDKATGGWYSRWERVYPGSAEVMEGGDPYYDWMESLIERGIIDPCPIYVLERLHGRYRGLHAEAVRDKLPNAELLGRKVKAIETELEAARLEAMGLNVDDAPAKPAPAAESTAATAPEVGDPNQLDGPSA